MTKKAIFICCDTNGLHNIKGSLPVYLDNVDKWARLLGMYYEVCERKDQKMVPIIKKKTIVNPQGFDLNPMACKINGFTDEYVENNGMPISEALKNLKDDLKGVSIIIGHNLEFHLKAIQAECLRDGNTLIEFKNLILIDLIDFNHNMDYPKMKDLCEKILGEELKLKSRYTNVVYLRKIFDKLYNTMESDIKTGTAQ